MTVCDHKPEIPKHSSSCYVWTKVTSEANLKKLIAWLRDEHNRGALGFITGGVAVVGAAVWTLYVYFYPPFQRPMTEIETTFLICRGDAKDACPSDAVWIGCPQNGGPSFGQAASQLCVGLGTALQTELFAKPGGSCGYSLHEVNCKVQK